jgi:hypothetical protein
VSIVLLRCFAKHSKEPSTFLLEPRRCWPFPLSPHLQNSLLPSFRSKLSRLPPGLCTPAGLYGPHDSPTLDLGGSLA